MKGIQINFLIHSHPIKKEQHMNNTVETQAPLESVLKDEIIRMYQEVADNPDHEFHFFHGHRAAEMFNYNPE